MVRTNICRGRTSKRGQPDEISSAAANRSKCRGEVHFDELARESEPTDSQQRACGRECRADDRECEPLPGGRENGTVVANDIDHGPNDVVCLRADSSERDSGVGRDLINLAVDVVAADQGTGRIDRALTREERETSCSRPTHWRIGRKIVPTGLASRRD